MTPSNRFRMALSLALLVVSWRADARDLTFEERVDAQQAIERVYYAHQIGATRRFDEAVPRSLLENKVRSYLRQSLALEAIWGTRITGDMLQKELLRMSAGTRMPERLRELFAALGDDPLRIRECLARPALVGRLTRNFYDYGPAFHDQSRRQADALATDMSRGRIDPWSDHPGRAVTELTRGESGAADLDAALALLPQDVGRPGPVVEERRRFVVRVPLKQSRDEIRFATYAVEKIPYDEWWQSIEGRFDERSVEAATVAAEIPSITVAAGNCADDTWDNGSLDDTPLARGRHTAVWTGSVMIIWGGSRQRGGRYDPATDTWAPISTTGAPPVPSTDNTGVWTGSRMIVWGGNSGAVNLNTGGLYDPVADAWSPMTTNGAPEARYRHTAVWTGDRMIVWGGTNNAGAALATGASYDPGHDRWRPTATANAPTARAAHTAVWTGSRVIVWGGTSDGAGAIYDPQADSWSPVSAINAPGARYYHTAVWTGKVMIVWGGENLLTFGNLNTGSRYDPSSDTWSPTSLLNAPSSRGAHTAVWTGNRMIVWGGQTNGGSVRFNTGATYDPDADAWTPMTTTNPPEGRYFHTAVWTGNLMVVWGGGNSVQSSNTGGRYDPATNTWTPTSTGGAPGPRSGHATAWTGTLMLVWGAADNSGGRYDPALDSWSFTSTLNAPLPRSGMTTVWTGSVMVVWGGTNSAGSIYYYTGGRYDPIADAWSPTSTVNAPVARTSHTAVWTGAVMAVWGGYWITSPPFNIRMELNTGGRYDPVADTWSAMTTTGAPTARERMASVWTGRQMIVWGGLMPSTPTPYPNTGGRYDPIADLWSPTSTTNAPEGRDFPTGTWTGREAIFWGGGSNVNTGGRYDPSTDTWIPTSVTNAPVGRSRHGAVWTGREMIVYGGSQTPGGGRYDPAADTWRPVSVVDIPPSQILMSDVWTGTFMVIWGGQTASSSEAFNTGGRYCACSWLYYADGDGDGVGDSNSAVQSCEPPPGYAAVGGDCNDADGSVWGVPGETRDLTLQVDTSISWSPPSSPGGTAPVYDLLRSGSVTDFTTGAVCIASDRNALSAVDAETPALGSLFMYLVRAQTSCAAGQGPLGFDSTGAPRSGRSCP